jgi:phosphatidylinositol dimannoside acyltransferase
VTDDPPAFLRRGLLATAGLLHGLGPARGRLADAIGLAAWAADGPRRRNTAANHLRLGAASQAEARRLARGSFRAYARTNVDFVWANAMNADQVMARSRLIGLEHVEAAASAGRGGVLALSHFGNWDFAALVGWSLGLKITTVMAPIANPAITRLVIWARERNALQVYPPSGAARGLLRAVRQGRFAALLCDVAEAGPQAPVQYCGGMVQFSLVPAWLAMRTGTPLLPASCWRGGRGEPEYLVEAHPPVVPEPGEDEAAVMQRVARVLEGDVRAHPDQWYPFRNIFDEPGLETVRTTGRPHH